MILSVHNEILSNSLHSGQSSMDNNNGIIIYQDENGVTKVNVRFSDEDVWLTQQQLAEIYETSQENVSMHIKNIFKDSELDENRTYKKFLLVRTEGNRQVKRNIDHYNLDVVIALGYRVQSQVATRFRRWATERLHEYIQKGFAMDYERLKQGGNRYFRELLQRIRDIRASERNFYQQVTDIYATSIDYDPRADLTKQFFATIQNKLHYAVHGGFYFDTELPDNGTPSRESDGGRTVSVFTNQFCILFGAV